MVAFHDVRLPDDIERGATGGPSFLTSSHRLASGQRIANQEWDQPLGEYDIGYGIQDLDGLRAVHKFWMCRRGSAYAFRFKDWFDYQMARQVIGTGDAAETNFQIVNRYDDGGPLPFDRIIQLPVSGTVQIWINSVLATEGVDYTVAYTTGIITTTSPVPSGQDIEVECEFDVPVSFDRDDFRPQVETFQNGKVPKILLQIERL